MEHLKSNLEKAIKQCPKCGRKTRGEHLEGVYYCEVCGCVLRLVKENAKIFKSWFQGGL